MHILNVSGHCTTTWTTGVCYTTNTLSSDILFVCLFVFSFFFSLFFFVAASSVSILWKNEIIKFLFFFFFFIPNDVGCQNPFQSVLLHLYLSSYIWACTCQYCQHHASFLWNRCLWLEEFNSQTEADSMIWQKFWKMLI